jgi:hypothetical protein
MKSAFAVLGVALVLFGCTQPVVDANRDETKLRLAKCTERYGYDPSAPGNVGERELAAGELEWRSCAYETIEATMATKAARPEAFRALINADRRMTRQIADGTLTRTERRAKLEQMIEQVMDDERDVERQANLQRLQEAQARQEQIDAFHTGTATRTMDAQLSTLRARMAR